MTLKDDDVIRELFGAVDFNASGYIDETELAAVVDLTPFCLKQVFSKLDADRDGKISINEFVENYALFQSFASDVTQQANDVTQQSNDVSRSIAPDSLNVAKAAKKEHTVEITNQKHLDTTKQSLDSGFTSAGNKKEDSSGKSTPAENVVGKTPTRGQRPLRTDLKHKAAKQLGQEYLDDLYEIARSRDDPMLLDSLENFLAATVDNLLRKQAENEHLELSLKRATLKNTEMTSQLEQEMDAHVNMLEEKIRQEEQRKLDAQKKQAQNELVRAQRELSEMENRVKELEEKIEQKSVEASIPDQIIEEMQEKEKENEKLRSQLLEFQTQMAVMRTDVTNMKSEYDEQSLRLNQERGTVMSCVREQENLTRQLHMLHEANKKLHDTNDDLRTAVESQRNSLNESMSPTKRAMSQHFSRGTLPNLHSSFRSDPGRQAKDMLRGYTTHTTDFDDTDVEDISGRSLLPYDDDDEDVNEESLMSELMQADQHMTGSKDRSKVSRSLSNSVLSSPQRQHLDREHFVAQLQILCDTNRRLGESNDELRQALGLLSERVPPRSPTKRCMSPAGCQSAPVTPAKQTFRGEECCASSPRKKAYNTTTTTSATEDEETSFENKLSDTQGTSDDFTEVDDEVTCIETSVLESSACESCTCGKIIMHNRTMCDDCTTIAETEAMSSLMSDTTIDIVGESKLEDTKTQCTCGANNANVTAGEKCKTCEQTVVVETENMSVQCELECVLSESAVTLDDENNNTQHPLEKSVQVGQIKTPVRTTTTMTGVEEDVIEQASMDETEQSLSMEQMFEALARENSPGVDVCPNCQTEKKVLTTGVSVCVCNNNVSLLRDMDRSINQLPESTILTDSDEEIDISLMKRGNPVGGESFQDATYETKYRRTNMSRDNIWLNSNTSSVLQNIESELSRVGRHENEASDDDMEEEELVRLVDESNDISTSLSISDEELLTTTQGGVRGREVAPKSDKRVPVQGDRPEKRSVVVFNELPSTHQPKGVRGLGVGADTVDTNFTETANHEPEDLGKPEKVYKLVLAGNAAVGKSSFIIRLCRDKFYSALNSTFGVDFQLKTMRVDGVTVALQLWDTAGQERFRSIAKSYFRKVDGVILMYDVTCENSFADVRDWVESIEEGATNKLPIMICGNKVDMRRRCLSQGMPVVARSEGRRLAEEIGAMFVETSAKDGSNVNNACLEFARLLQQNEAEKLTPNASNGLSLGNGQNKQAPKKTACCR